MNNLADMLVANVIRRAERICGNCDDTDICRSCKLRVFLDQIEKETYSEGYKAGEEFVRSLI
jgi:hypothetical protein